MTGIQTCALPIYSGSLEDMISRFKQTSDEKMSDLKRGNESRRGYSRRGQKQ